MALDPSITLSYRSKFFFSGTVCPAKNLSPSHSGTVGTSLPLCFTFWTVQTSIRQMYVLPSWNRLHGGLRIYVAKLVMLNLCTLLVLFWPKSQAQIIPQILTNLRCLAQIPQILSVWFEWCNKNICFFKSWNGPNLVRTLTLFCFVLSVL